MAHQGGRGHARGGLGGARGAGIQVHPARGGRGRRGHGAGAVQPAAPAMDGRGPRGRRGGNPGEAAARRGGRGRAGGDDVPAPRHLQAQRNHRSGVNENHAPKVNLVIDPCEMKVYKVKATELTGNPDTDKLIRDYVASFNEIQQERCRYVELKSVGADAMELEGRMNFINSLVAKSKRMRRPIRRAGGIPREHPPHFKRVPKC